MPPAAPDLHAPTRRAAPLPPHARRAAIVAALVPLVVEHGDAVTTRQIAAAAGVSEGTIFNVFDDKDELLRAAFDAVLDPEPYERALAAIDPALPFEQRLREAVDATQRRIVVIWQVASRLGPRLTPHLGPLPVSPALVEMMRAADAQLRVDAVEAARLLRALTLSLTHPQLAGDPLPAERIVELFLHGVAGAR